MILPTPYTLSSSVLVIGDRPVPSGGSGDIFKGTLDGTNVCVKRVGTYSKEGPEKVVKVHYPTPSLSPLSTANKSCRNSARGPLCANVWYTQTSSPSWVSLSPPSSISLNGCLAGIQQGAPRRGPTWLRGCPLVAFDPTLTLVTSYQMSPKAFISSAPST